MGVNVKKAADILVTNMLSRPWFISLWSQYVHNSSRYRDNIVYHEYYLSKNKSEGERYCILRYPIIGLGIAALCKNALVQCEWAESNHMIPVVDFEWEHYLEEDVIGHDNVWEYVFKPNASLHELLNNSKDKYILVGAIGRKYANRKVKRKYGLESPDIKFICGGDWREYYRKLNAAGTKWLRIQDEVYARYKGTFSRLFRPEMKIMGVALREEFSIDAEESGIDILKAHPHHLTVDRLIPIIKEYQERWGCSHIFVTTYFEDSIACLKSVFGDALLYTDRRRVPFAAYTEIRQWVAQKFEKTDDRREFVKWLFSGDQKAVCYQTYDRDTVVEYMEEVYGLSLCDCMLCSYSSGALIGAILNGGNYEHLQVLPS